MTTKIIRFRLRKFFFLILPFALSFISTVAFSQLNNNVADTTDEILYASNAKAVKQLTLVKESNVEYPAILKGNEDEALEYVEKFSKERKEYITKMYKKGKKILPKVVNILKKHKIPQEFKVLMIIESAYNGNAISPAGAVGYWQFMEAAAKEYGLKCATTDALIEEKQSASVKDKSKKNKKPIVVDDRKNFNKSTNAAARYLKDRRKNLGDNWLLIAASYNCGIGNVRAAMQKSGVENPTFWDIKKYLPNETKNYVMNFLALNVIYKNYDKFLNDDMVFENEYAEQLVFERTETPLSEKKITEKAAEKKSVKEEESAAPESF